MVITKTILKKIINEEIEAYLSEVGMCHDPDSGHFDDCDPGNIYSLTSKGAKDNNIDDEYVQRGKVSSKKKRKPPKVSAKFGINTSDEKAAGRKKISGQDISPKYSVSKYPKKYGQNEKLDHPLVPKSEDSESDRLDKLGYTHHLRALGRGIIRADEQEVQPDESTITIKVNLLMDLIGFALDGVEEKRVSESRSKNPNAAFYAKCRQLGFTTTQEAQKAILIALNNFQKASAGKLFEPEKQQKSN